MKAQLLQGAKALGLALSETQIEQLLAYQTLLAKWNARINLTAITDPVQMLIHHLLDSLSIAPYLQGPSLLDVGSGAGLPGIPLAIIKPQWAFTLLDSNNKKTAFLLQAKAVLGLSNIEIVQERVEKYNPLALFSDIMARAVSSLASLVTQTERLLQTEGQWVLMKGKYPADEIAELTNPCRVQALSVPGLDAERHVVIIPKTF